MITRTSQPASGAMLISEMKEFASFPKATQRYIRRSLDVAYGRRDPIECWARDEGEAASIRAQARLYKQLDHLRLQVPDDSGLDMRPPSANGRKLHQSVTGCQSRNYFTASSPAAHATHDDSWHGLGVNRQEAG